MLHNLPEAAVSFLLSNPEEIKRQAEPALFSKESDKIIRKDYVKCNDPAMFGVSIAFIYPLIKQLPAFHNTSFSRIWLNEKNEFWDDESGNLENSGKFQKEKSHLWTK